MSVPGTRLDKLLALKSRLEHEIAHERRKEALAERRWHTYTPRRMSPEPLHSARSIERGYEPQLAGGDRGQAAASASITRSWLDELGVTSLAVKLWAIRAGYLTRVPPGRVSTELLEKYAAAHPRRS